MVVGLGFPPGPHVPKACLRRTKEGIASRFPANASGVQACAAKLLAGQSAPFGRITAFSSYVSTKLDLNWI